MLNLALTNGGCVDDNLQDQVTTDLRCQLAQVSVGTAGLYQPPFVVISTPPANHIHGLGQGDVSNVLCPPDTSHKDSNICG